MAIAEGSRSAFPRWPEQQSCGQDEMTSEEAVQVVSQLLAKNAEAGYEILTEV